MDSFYKVPPHGVVRGWLGAQLVGRLLMYAQSNKHRFEESSVAHGTSNRIDLTRRISRRLDDLGDLSLEIRCKMRELLPAMFGTLGKELFNPTFELELVAHG